jgi:hypothetical protein
MGVPPPYQQLCRIAGINKPTDDVLSFKLVTTTVISGS